MIAKGCAALLSLYLALAPGCNSKGGDTRKSPTPQQPAPTQQATVSSKAGACGLLTPEDIEAVQGEGVKDVKGSEQTGGPLAITQCFYATPSYNKSVILTLTQRNAASAEAGNPKELWKKQFGGEAEREKRREKEKERGRDKDSGESHGEEEEGERPAQRVEGVGDEAYWVGNQKFGVLYVLKGERFLRISIGGPEAQQVKIEKMKALAKRALKRLGRG